MVYLNLNFLSRTEALVELQNGIVLVRIAYSYAENAH